MLEARALEADGAGFKSGSLTLRRASSQPHDLVRLSVSVEQAPATRLLGSHDAGTALSQDPSP